MNKFRLKYNGEYDVELLKDGASLEGVSNIRIELEPERLPVVTLEFSALRLAADLSEAQLKVLLPPDIDLSTVDMLLKVLTARRLELIANA